MITHSIDKTLSILSDPTIDENELSKQLLQVRKFASLAVLAQEDLLKSMVDKWIGDTTRNGQFNVAWGEEVLIHLVEGCYKKTKSYYIPQSDNLELNQLHSVLASVQEHTKHPKSYQRVIWEAWSKEPGLPLESIKQVLDEALSLEESEDNLSRKLTLQKVHMITQKVKEAIDLGEPSEVSRWVKLYKEYDSVYPGGALRHNAAEIVDTIMNKYVAGHIFTSEVGKQLLLRVSMEYQSLYNEELPIHPRHKLADLRFLRAILKSRLSAEQKDALQIIWAIQPTNPDTNWLNDNHIDAIIELLGKHAPEAKATNHEVILRIMENLSAIMQEVIRTERERLEKGETSTILWPEVISKVSGYMNDMVQYISASITKEESSQSITTDPLEQKGLER